MLKASSKTTDKPTTRTIRIRDSFRELIAIFEKKIRPKTTLK